LLIYGIVGLGTIVLCVLVFIAYFVISIGEDGITYDGLGRELEPTPAIAQMVFSAEREWPGLKWFVIDVGVFWVSVAVGFTLARVASKIYDSDERRGIDPIRKIKT